MDDLLRPYIARKPDLAEFMGPPIGLKRAPPYGMLAERGESAVLPLTNQLISLMRSA